MPKAFGSNNCFSSLSVIIRQAFGLLPRPTVTSSFRHAASVLLARANFGANFVLTEDPFSVENLCKLRQREDNVCGS